MDELRTALESLRRKRTDVQDELMKLDAAIAQLEVIVEGGVAPTGTPGRGGLSYEGLGIADAAVRYIREAGGPRSTREIADAIRMRGVKTTSKNYTATVYAVLAASKDRIVRTADGAWELVSKHTSSDVSSVNNGEAVASEASA